MIAAIKSANDDLLEPGLINDPFPYYRELREHRPVQWNERWRGWIVAGYDDVYFGLHDPRMMADTVTPYFQPLLYAEIGRDHAACGRTFRRRIPRRLARPRRCRPDQRIRAVDAGQRDRDHHRRAGCRSAP